MARLGYPPGLVGSGGGAGLFRPTRLAALLLGFALLGLSVSLGAPPARAQDMPSVGELRHLIAVRDAQQAHKPKVVVKAAHAYLKAYPKGPHADEVLVDLARAHAALKQDKAALQTYHELIKTHPDSPFREQAMANSVPLLAAQGQQKAAMAQVTALLKAYPDSVQKGRVLLWKANEEYAQNDYAATLATLKGIDPQQDLQDAQQSQFYRLDTLALVKSNQSAWGPLQQYLKLTDTPEHKAEVLMLVGSVARSSGRPEEALRFYSQVVEDYPVPGALGEALYWRAQLFASTRVAQAPPEVLAARRQTAIGYYSAYLTNNDKTHRGAAFAERAALERQAGQSQAALDDYAQAVQADPKLAGDATIMQARVDLLLALKKREQAAALMDAASKDTRLSPAQRTSFQVQEASLQYDAKDCADVERLLDPMPIVADPTLRARAFFMRGFCRYRQKEWEKATFDLEALINDPAYQNVVLQPLLDAYEKSGQYSRLVNMEEELMAAGRVPPSVDLLTRLANGYGKLKEPGLMLGAYQRLAKLSPAEVQKPDIQLRMGLAREQLGQRAAALAQYRAVLAHPDPAKSVSRDTYFTALEHLQALDLAEGKTAELPALYKAARVMATDAQSKARLAALEGGLGVARAQRDLAAGRPARALKPLEGALKRMPAGQPERRAHVAALLIVAYAGSGEGHKAKELYKSERGGAGAADYRAKLATELVAEVEAVPDALVAPAKSPAAPAKPAKEGRGKGAHARAEAKERAKARAADGRNALAGVFHQALDDLPPGQAQARYRAAKLLDKAYQQEGNQAARAALVTGLLKDGLDAKTQHELRIYQAQIYRDWGQSLLNKGDLEGAQFQLERGLKDAADADWRLRYQLTALLSQVELKRKRYSDVVLRTEKILPHIEDKALAGQVRHFLGQVFVEWGRQADAEHNVKSARIRYHYALDYLPASDWQRRLAATHGLAQALQAKGRDADAAAAYEAVIPQIADPHVKQQYALYLGKLYADKLKDSTKATHWLALADTGGKDPLSLEAGYLWADQELARHHDEAALKRLEALAARGIRGTRWEVPIQYRIAVLLHEGKHLKAALTHYRAVADVKNAEERRLYPRTIEQSRTQVRRIEAYLKAGGGQGGVAVPTVRPD